MKRIFTILVLSLVCGLSTSFGQDFLPHKILLKVNDVFRVSCQNDAINIPDLQAILKDENISKVNRMFKNLPLEKNRTLHSDISLMYEFDYDGDDVLAAIRNLQKTHYFDYVEPYYLFHPYYYPNDPQADTAISADLFYQRALWVHTIYQAWDITKGDSNILIGISDTGVNIDHEDLEDNIYKNTADPVDGVDNDADGLIDNYYGYDFSDNDNNPREMSGSHGTGVAGIVSATTDNNLGIAGIAFYAKLVPLKCSSDAVPGNVDKGYQSVQFGAFKGYDIMNLSWGCVDCYQRSLQDIINYAVLDRNMIVVGSSGNNEAEEAVYPASYDNVLSVSGIFPDFRKANNKSWHYYVDLVALGVGVHTTQRNGGYGNSNGTSFAAPIVAGAAALVKDVFPNYSAQQIMEQIRVTANDTIYNVASNASYFEKLGKGSLDVFQAVTNTTTPSIRNIARYQLGNSWWRSGDTVEITGNFVNYLNPTSTLIVTLSAPSTYITMIDSVFTAGVINTMDTATNTSAFRFRIASNCPVNEQIWLRFGYEDNDYHDFQYLPATLNPDFLNIAENRVWMTANSTGNFGYNIPMRELGIGVLLDQGLSSLLYEGGLMVSIDSTYVSDNIRASTPNFNENFKAVEIIETVDPLGFSDYKATCLFNDTTGSPSENNVGITVRNNYYAWNSAPNDGFIIAEYEITNTNAFPLYHLHVGLFADWDIAASNRDIAGWDSLGFGYVTTPSFNDYWVGIKPLWPYHGKYYAIENNPAITGNMLGIYDGFTDAEKHTTLSNGADKITAGGALGEDVSHTVSANIGTLNPGETTVMAFAIMAGNSLDDLRNSALAAQSVYGNQVTFQGPVPNANEVTVCAGTSATLTPSGGTDYLLFYAENDYLVLDSGTTLVTPPVEDTTVFYIAQNNFPFPGIKQAVTVNTYQPEIDFWLEPDTLYLADRNYIYAHNTSPFFTTSLWDMGNGTTSTFSTANSSYVVPGSYLISLTIEDADDCPNSLTKELMVFTGSAPIVDNISESNDGIKVFPSYVDRTIHITQLPQGVHRISIFNQVGEVVLQDNILTTNCTLNVSSLPAGMYYLHIDDVRPIKIVKQ